MKRRNFIQLCMVVGFVMAVLIMTQPPQLQYFDKQEAMFVRVNDGPEVQALFGFQPLVDGAGNALMNFNVLTAGSSEDYIMFTTPVGKPYGTYSVTEGGAFMTLVSRGGKKAHVEGTLTISIDSIKIQGQLIETSAPIDITYQVTRPDPSKHIDSKMQISYPTAAPNT